MRLCRLLSSVLLLAAMPAVGRAELRDNAKMFSPQAAAEAREVIKDIESKFNRRVVVETIAELPADRKAALDKAGKNKADRARVFVAELEARAKASGANGIFVLITKSPGNVTVESDRSTRENDFTLEHARELQTQLAASFRENKFDEGLLAGLDFVRTTIQAARREVRAPEVAKPSNAPLVRAESSDEKGWTLMGSICLIAGVVLFFWVVLALIRAFTGSGQGPAMPRAQGYDGPGYAGGPGFGPSYGGGGFFSNFMSGMFGAVAGNWIYHNMFGGGHSLPHFGGSAQGADPAGMGASPDAGDGRFDGAGVSGDYDDSPGDYGASPDVGGGGDWGGSSGDDYGGGDFGGGGDWGGGGDFGGGDGDF
jgi:uncharacterized protein